MHINSEANSEILLRLRKELEGTILPLITSDYVLWGLPYYDNPGDTLIWEGALNLLRKCKYRCVGTCGWNDYRHVPLRKDIVILIIGGGFFGDVWRKAWDIVMNTVTLYPDNPVVILPQSIYYNNIQIAYDDASRLSALKRLTICTRDTASFEYARKYFQNNILFCPDLAFYCDVEKLFRHSLPEKDKILFLKRNDKEQPASLPDVKRKNMDYRDWPSMEGKISFSDRVLNKIIYGLTRVNRNRKLDCLATAIYKYCKRNITIRDAVRFISAYRIVYTTRLHAMILSFLLNKEVYIVDNSYGKVSGCYKSWLSECKTIHLVNE